MPDPTPPAIDPAITPPAPATPPVAPPPATPVVPGTGEPVPDYKALYEETEGKRRKDAERLTALEKQEEDRKTAALSDIEREKKRADDATQRAQKLEREKLIDQVAAEAGLSADAKTLLSGEDEATLKANAAKLAAIQKQPITAGTTTQPTGSTTPTLDDQITAAEKSGDYQQSIALKRQRANW